MYSIIKNLCKIILLILYRIEVYGGENIPKDKGCIVCANHYHWLDPVIVACFFNRPVHFMAKTELFENKIFGFILKRINAFPVNREKADITAIKNAIKIVKAKKVLGIFPEGTRVKQGGKMNVEPGIAMIGIKGKAEIMPIGISGNYKAGSKLKVNMGQPILLEDHYGKKLNTEEFTTISENIMLEVRKLIMKV